MLNTKNDIFAPLLTDAYEVFASVDEKKYHVAVWRSLVSMANGEHDLPSELVTKYDELNRASMVNKSYFCIIESDENVEITLKYNGSYNTIDVENKDFCLNDGIVTFVVCPDEVVTVKLDSEFKHCLRIICNAPCNAKNDHDNIIEFKPGYYSIENCKYITEGKRGFPIICDIPDNTTVLVHHGAVINASFVLENKHNIKICGGGMINTINRCFGYEKSFSEDSVLGPLQKYTYPAVYIKTNSSDITVEGITMNCEFRGIVIRNGENITISKVKIFTNCVNADGINMVNARHIRILGSFIHSHDDGIAIFTSCDSITYLDDAECSDPVPVTEDIEIAYSKIITACRPFCVGGHATGSTDPHDRLANIYAHDLDITNYRRYYGFHDIEHARKWSGVIRLLSQTEQLITNVRFENIVCHKKDDYEGQPIHIEARGSDGASYAERGGYRIDNVIFKNISFRKMNENDLPSGIFCSVENEGDDYCIDNITFDNITFGGEKMDDSPKYIETKGKVFNITIK